VHLDSPPRQQAEQAPLYQGSFHAPAETAWDYLVFKIQDRFRALQRVQGAIKESGGAIDEAADAYLHEELFPRRAAGRIEEFNQDMVEPLMKEMATSGITIDELEDYLHARHAPEANARLKALNPDRTDNDSLSGMSDDVARNIMAAARADGSIGKLESLAKRVDAINESRLRILESEGLESAKTIKQWRDTYKFYVPLHREGVGPTGMPTARSHIMEMFGRRQAGSEQRINRPRGRGYNIAGRESKLRAGSHLAVGNILANVVANHEIALLRAEKNQVGRAMMRLVQANPNPELWRIDHAESVARLNKETGFIEYVDSHAHRDPKNHLSVKIDGKEHWIWFSPRNVTAMRMAHSLGNLGADTTNSLTTGLLFVNRYLAMINTGLDPEFIVGNMIRDVQTAGLNLQTTEARALTGRIMKDWGTAWKGIRAAQAGDLSGAWAGYYREFEQAGGTTGWMQSYDTIQSREADLRSMLARMQPDAAGQARRAVRETWNYVMDQNAAVENAVRLSAFVHARRMGLSTNRAASLAKNLTVNFNRRGDAGLTLNALYLFANASIQGSARMLLSMRHPRGRKIAAAIIAFGFVMDIVARMMGGDDDDGVPYYDKIPHWIKERNLIVMLPGTGGDYVKMPLPWGYNALYAAGTTIGQMAPWVGNQNIKLSTAGANLITTIFGSFNPLGSSATLIQMISPTIFDPIVQWSQNKDFAGRMLRPEQDPWGAPKPEHTMYWRSTSEPSKGLSRMLNDLTGGDDVRPGAINVSPALFDHAWGVITGGIGRFLSRAIDVPAKLLTAEELTVDTIPFVRRVVGTQSPSITREKFYNNLLEVEIAVARWKRYASDPDKREKVRREEKAPLSLKDLAGQYRKQMSANRRRRNKLLDDKTLGIRARTAQVNAIEDQMLVLMKKFNGIYRQRMKQE
jgi:hypothetical protein